jgi:hypothetical protein
MLWEMSGYKSYNYLMPYFYFITSVMIINFIYAEIVYMNIVTFCTEKIYFGILVEMVGFEREIL